MMFPQDDLALSYVPDEVRGPMLGFGAEGEEERVKYMVYWVKGIPAHQSETGIPYTDGKRFDSKSDAIAFYNEKVSGGADLGLTSVVFVEQVFVGPPPQKPSEERVVQAWEVGGEGAGEGNGDEPPVEPGFAFDLANPVVLGGIVGGIALAGVLVYYFVSGK